MIAEMGKKVAVSFLKNNVITKEEVDVYQYGAELVISQTFATVAILGMGIALGKFQETVIYYLAYTFLRVYAGGFHASCYRNCNLIYLLSYFFINIIISCFEKETLALFLLIGVFVSDIVIIVLAPVADIHKKLELEEIKKYKYIVRRILLLINCLIVSIYLFVPELQDEMLYAMSAICEIAILLIIGSIKNYCYLKDKGGL